MITLLECFERADANTSLCVHNTLCSQEDTVQWNPNYGKYSGVTCLVPFVNCVFIARWIGNEGCLQLRQN